MLPEGFELGAPTKSVLLFVERYLLRMTRLQTTSRPPLAAIKTPLSRTKFNHERSTGPRV